MFIRIIFSDSNQIAGYHLYVHHDLNKSTPSLCKQSSSPNHLPTGSYDDKIDELKRIAKFLTSLKKKFKSMLGNQICSSIFIMECQTTGCSVAHIIFL
ncbi:unnamed protein product [Arabidopsis thaliana]|uniref:(thale cress) hypothetical protein n=1 Tax=Arabidopsis thaliana TaxID=3702 RepID=A0A7G2FG40_ARATH|nr:unnamed protein product [Arabidopsis thaliana]